MHIIFYLIPVYHKAGAMRAKYRTCGVFHISFRIISCLPDHFFRIMTGEIPFQAAKHPSFATGIGNHLRLIIPHGDDRTSADKNSLFSLHLRRFKLAAQPLDIRHGSSPRCVRISRCQLRSKISSLQSAKNSSPLPASVGSNKRCTSA